ncbi:MAG: DedA family protein, partial [Flavobacteriales bacterium]
MEFWEFIKSLTHPKEIIHVGGLALLLIIVFAENGLIIGFFLPGDSLIFLAGLICSTQPELLDVSISTLTFCMFVAAVAGSLFGYLFGLRVGPPVFERNESMLFKKKYVDVTKSFYMKHGG